MSRNGVLEMESFRLAQYSVPVPCYICGGGNNFDAELCRHCQAPMGLAEQVKIHKTQPQMVAVMGSAAAGKTVYLGMLTDMLSRDRDEIRLTTRGAFSVSLQQATIAALSSGSFPAKTPNDPDRWNWVHCQAKLRNRRRPVELIIPDVSGEALMEEIEHPSAYPVIRAFLGKCAAVIVLVDADRLARGDKDPDFAAMKMINYLCDLDPNPKQCWKTRPVAVVFTKADMTEGCFEDPDRFAKQRAPGLTQLCRDRLNLVRYFAGGVAGACALREELGGRRLVPLRIEPHGIVEPFHWVVQSLK